MNIRIGTAGWGYPTGRGSWNGIFYPPSTNARGSGRIDQLTYYAEHFDSVEVNSTFYRLLSPAVARSWVHRTPPGFEFSLKLYQKFTHPKMYREATGAPPGDPAQNDVEDVLRGLEPVAAAGRLGALLAQFPPSFKSDPPSRAYLDWLLHAFRDHRVAVELRHRSWSDDLDATLGLLNAHRAAWVQIDEPKFKTSIRQNYLPNVTGFYYMRLHGRNAASWWRHTQAEDRYDYLYRADELQPFAETAKAADRLVRKLYLYLNNHFAAKAVANATVLRHMLGLPVRGEYRTEMTRRYPELADIVPRSTGSDLLDAGAGDATRRGDEPTGAEIAWSRIGDERPR